MIIISQETLFFCLSNGVFFVDIEKVEEEEIEKKDLEKVIIGYTSCCHSFDTHCIIIKRHLKTKTKS